MKNKIIILIIGLFLISFISAEPNFVFKQNTITDLKIACFNEDNEFCASSVNCNITILYPNSTSLVDNPPMTYNINYFNYTLTASNMTTLGEYTVIIVCNENTSAGTTFTYQITKTGSIFNIPSAIIYIIVLITASGLFFLTLFASIKMPWKNPRKDDGYISHINYLKHGKIAFGFLSYLLAILIINILMGITNNFLFLNIAFVFFRTIYFILLTGLMIVVPGTVYIIVMNLLSDKRIKNFLSRGINIR